MNTTESVRPTLCAKLSATVHAAVRRYMEARESGTTRDFVAAEAAFKKAFVQESAQERIRRMELRLACERNLAEARARNAQRDRRRTSITRRVTYVDPIDG